MKSLLCAPDPFLPPSPRRVHVCLSVGLGTPPQNKSQLNYRTNPVLNFALLHSEEVKSFSLEVKCIVKIKPLRLRRHSLTAPQTTQ